MSMVSVNAVSLALFGASFLSAGEVCAKSADFADVSASMRGMTEALIFANFVRASFVRAFAASFAYVFANVSFFFKIFNQNIVEVESSAAVRFKIYGVFAFLYFNVLQVVRFKVIPTVLPVGKLIEFADERNFFSVHFRD